MNKRELIEDIADLNENLNQNLRGKHILIRLVIDQKLTTVFKKSIDTRITPASTLKLFILDEFLSEKKIKNQWIKVEEEDIVRGSGNNLKVEQSYQLNDLVKNLTVQSSNTSAHIIRRYLENISGKNIIQKINKQNMKYGMVNTNLMNVHGLPEKNQYISLNDFSLFLDNKITNKEFLRKLNIKQFEFFSLEGEKVVVENTFTIVNSHILGVKTGTLVPSIYNIVIFFEIDGLYGYLLSFYNRNAKDRENDVLHTLKILKNWKGKKI